MKEPPSMSTARNKLFSSSDPFQSSKSPEPPVQLLESRENAQSQAKKGSFMEYYNSIPKKSTTNLLEKYIKTKRWLMTDVYPFDNTFIVITGIHN